MNRLIACFTLLLLLFFGLSCRRNSAREGAPRFTLLEAGQTGIDFTNQLEYNADFNIYTYRNFYNGGGVGMGDFNQDGLIDLYFTANMKPNRLYLNRGDWRFEDVTEKAGVAGTKAWSTGVAVVDINGDGRLDIYVCNSGDVAGDNKQNELFINQGPGPDGEIRFTEEAAAYGLDDKGYSTHAVFFDYDKDGDLDCYLLNNSYTAIGSFNLRKNLRPVRDPVGGDKLFRNDGPSDGRPVFTDVSEEAGIYGSVIGFGLGVTVGDVNGDHWPDIYISNDFFERDYLYLNQQDGTFREVLTEQMRSISAASMGADMADINNDTRPDIFVTDMLPGTNRRVKTKTTFENWDKYQYNLENDYYHQFTRNMLHLNNGDGSFSEIGRLAGVEGTDWSWGALIADLDNDGWKDIFVANGIYQDLTDQDYIQFISHEETLRSMISQGGKINYKTLIDSIPIEQIPNYAFHNLGAQGEGIRFEEVTKAWGLDQLSHSNGSAYGDLDNDGDLDLVVNNVNMPAFVYRNETRQQAGGNYLRFEFEGEGGNTAALGASITLQHGQQRFFQEHMPMRGFESTMDNRPLLGLGEIDTIDAAIIRWPDGRYTVLNRVAVNQTLKLRQADGQVLQATDEQHLAPGDPSFAVHFQETGAPKGLDYVHKENRFSDFDRDRMLFHMLSTEGPAFCRGDLNKDGLEDFFIGGAKDMPGRIYLQESGGAFRSVNEELLAADQASEDTDAIFFDADNDGDLDLYVCSGGNEFSSSATALIDRLYWNDGKGNFQKSPQILPTSNFESTSCVRAADVDGDGDLDLFIGMRVQPFYYGIPVNGYLLENDGKGRFSEASAARAPELQKIGMITDAQWADFDGDKDPDLLIVGDWMAPVLFRNEAGRLAKVSNSGMEQSEGWWNCLTVADFDGDGDLDFAAGNHGWNSRFRAGPERPVEMYVNDFDQNSAVEQLIAQYEGDKLYPLVLKHDLIKQIPGLKKRYLRYNSFSDQTIQDIFPTEQLRESVHTRARVLGTSLFINLGKGKFERKDLPLSAQLAPVYALLAHDFDGDGKLDLLAAGNLYESKPEVGRYDASFGALLQGDGKGGFQSIPVRVSGLRLEGPVRDLAVMTGEKTSRLMVVRNNAPLQFFKLAAGERQGL